MLGHFLVGFVVDFSAVNSLHGESESRLYASTYMLITGVYLTLYLKHHKLQINAV